MAALENAKRFNLLAWHRGSFKTTLGVNLLIGGAGHRPGVYAYISPYRTQTKQIVWDSPEMLKKWLPKGIRRNESELKVAMRTPGGESVIYFLGSDNIDSIRGLHFDGLVLDEYGDISNRHGVELWQAVILPALQVKNGWSWILGTPRGDNHFKELFETAQGWNISLLKASDSGLIPKTTLDSYRQSMRQDFYEQEFECSFMKNAASFFSSVQEVVGDITPVGRDYVMGVDLAKKQDFTVCVVVERDSNRVVQIDRFNNVDWVTAKERIAKLVFKWRADVLCDSTGVGDPLVDELQKMGLSVSGYQFTQKSKTNLIRKLDSFISQKFITIPNDPDLISELQDFQYEVGKTGLSFSAPSGKHDDMVCALALAVWKLEEPQEAARAEWESAGFIYRNLNLNNQMTY